MTDQRLNIGAGTVNVPGWVNADREPLPQYHEGMVYADMRYSLPWSDGAYRYVVCNHALQMLEYREVQFALREMRRVLVTGGVLRLLVPDVVGAFEAHRRGAVEWFPAIVGDETTIDGLFSTYLTWYGTARTAFTAGWLVELCKRAGFMRARQAQPGVSVFAGPEICELDSRPNESVVVEALR